ncbi:MAG: CPBP family intramembrane metalloprotease [Leptospiraceae bacterium]|nr:CPBP family intramembrane metalloprotease [Leptospiraceae bacterium]
MWTRRSESRRAVEPRALAGLYWSLLPQALRRQTARHLTAQETDALFTAKDQYRSMLPDRRRQIELQFGSIWHRQATAGIWRWGTAFAAAALMVWNSVEENSLSWTARLLVYNGLVLAVLAPWAIGWFPVWQRRLLLGVEWRWEWVFSSFLVYIALLWLLIEINSSALAGPVRGFVLSRWIILVSGALAAPLFEEIVFRQLLPSLFGSDPYWGGQVTASVLFALAHLPVDGSMFLLYWLAALLLALLRIQTGSLVWGIGAHSLANLVVLLL